MKSPSKKAIESRKRDHLKLARSAESQFTFDSGFQRWHLIPNALPELDLSEVDTSTTFLGKRLSFPFLISSMSGGVDEAYKLNRDLASAAQTMGCALGLGSIRPALENPDLLQSFSVAREHAPDAVILGNLGLAQLTQEISLDAVAELCKKLGVDALIIHLNAMQEAIQPEGEPFFRGGLKQLGHWLENFPLPLVVKEVGQGISPERVLDLKALGFEWIDVAGAGGTNWISIEGLRLGQPESLERRIAAEFQNFGSPTAEILIELDPKLTGIIVSGGLRSPMDMVKSLAMGASIAASAAGMLEKAMDGGHRAVIDELTFWQQTLKIAMFGMGQRDIPSLRGNRKLLRHD